MAFSTSGSISLVLVAMVGCLCSMTAAGQDVLSPSAERQSRQMFVTNPQFYHFYNPYVMMPVVYPHQASAFPIYPASAAVIEGEYTKLELSDRAARDAIIIIPANAECLSATIENDGIGPCVKTSGAKRGSISIKFPVTGQTAVVAIVRSSTSRITLRCSDMNAVAAFTQTGGIADKSVVRTETGVMQLVVTSTGDNGVMKCTW